MHATLNRVYKVIWCKVRLAWVAVSEVASGCGKVQSSTRRSNREVADADPAQATGLQALLQAGSTQLVPLRQWVQHALAHTPSTQHCWGMAFSAMALATGAAMAAPPAPTQLPTGGQVAAGLANIVQSANTLTVNQASPRAVINWNTFNVGSQATVNFVQPSQSSVALNRVLQADPSQIYGQINANGQVYLVNPAGVYFAPGASVNVGGIVATTHQMADADFMAGKTSFERNGATGSVVNEGSIQASLGGYIAMLAPEVRNSGVLVAQSGTVALAAGERITLNFAAANGGQSKLDSLTVTAAQLDTLVENRQAVRAPNGLIILSAQSAQLLAASVVNSGSLEAQGVSQVGGRIVLDAGTATGAGASVIHSGRINASSDSAQGGQITVTGDTIRLGAGSSISASGPTGGGTVLVGGDWQGSGNLHQATTVGMEAGASVDASATAEGDGGKVVLWSNVSLPGSLTQVDGSIRAVGAGTGASAGVGGQIETSGHLLGIGPNASVVAGVQGQWLIDPADVTISNGANSNWSARGANYEPNVSASTVVINVSSLTSALNTGTSVTVTTWNGTTAGGTGNGDITVANAINWSGLGTLSLFASRNIALNASVVASGQGAGFKAMATGSISAGAANLLFQTNNGTLLFWSNFNAASGGGIAMNQNGLTFNTANGSTTQTTGGGHIVFAGGSMSQLDADGNPTGAALSSGYGISFNPAVAGNNLTRIYSGGGNITMNASSTGSVGLYFWQATDINAGNGAVNISARSASSMGMEFNAGGGATSGTSITGRGITLTGTSDTGDYTGLLIQNNFANIVSTGSGDVRLTGTSNGSTAGSAAVGLNLRGTVSITSADGQIVLTGTSRTSTGVNHYGGSVQSTGAGSISVTGTSTSWAGIYRPNAMNYTTTSGNITFNATGSSGMDIAGGNITTTTGHVLFNGVSTDSGAAVAWSSAANVTTAGGSIAVNGSASSGRGISSSSNLTLTVSQGAGGISINGTSNGSSKQGIFLNGTAVNLSTASGDITITGTSGTAAIEYFAGLIQSTAGGSILINANSTGWAGFYQPNRLNFSTTSGDISILANGGGAYHALHMGGGNITTTSGNVLLKGATAGTQKAVYFTGVTNVTTVGGNISVNGTGATQAGIQLDAGLNLDTSQGSGSITVCGTSANYIGVYVSDVNAVTLTTKSASGAINITGTAGDDNQGVFIYKGNISSTTGAINLSGTSSTGTGLEVNQTATNITSTSGNMSFTGRTTSGSWGIHYTGTEISSAGNISFVSDAGMRVNANVYSKGAGNPLVFKSNGGIWNTQTQTIQTNNGSLVFWANGSTAAGVHFDNEVVTLNTANGSTTQTSGGGQLIIGSGATTDTNGYPTGAVQRGGDWAISFGGGSSGYGVIHTGGGDISMRGNASGGSGILITRTTSINAGNGNITLVGGGSSTGAAIYLNAYNGAYNITAGGDITLQGTGGAYGIRSYYDSLTAGGTIRSTGGKVTLTGTGNTQGVYLYSNISVVADVGDISITGNGSTQGIVANGQILAGAGNITLSSPLTKIWMTATVGQLAGSVVTSSSTNISVSATSLFDGQGPTFNTAGNVTLTTTEWNLGSAKIGTTGHVGILPLTSAGFSNALNLSKLVVNPTINGVSYTPASLTIGNASSASTSLVYLDSAAAVAGNISVIGGGVQVSQNLTSNTGNIWLQGTSASADVTTSFTSSQKIFASANGSIATLRSARSVLLSSGEISAGTTVLWSGYNNTSTYGVDMGSTDLSSGNVWIGGTSSSNGSLRWHGAMVGDGPVSGATPVQLTSIDAGVSSRVNGDVLIWASNGSTRNGIYLPSPLSILASGEVTLLTPTVTGALAGTNLTVLASAFNWSPASGTFGDVVWSGSGTTRWGAAAFRTAGVFANVDLLLSDPFAGGRALLSTTIGRYAGMSYANGTAFVLGNTGNLSYTSMDAGAYLYTGNLSLHGKNLTINAPISLDANSTVVLGGNTTLSAHSVAVGSLLLQDGSFNLSNVSNSVGTLAATNVTSLSYVNNGTLTLGSAGGVDGITATGAVAIGTQTGNLAITQTVNSSSTGTSAIVLTAGATDAVNVTSGGNITVSGSGALDTPGRAVLYTGGVTGSTGLTDLIGSGSGNFRYNSTAAATGYSLVLGSTGDYAIYRERPLLTVRADNQTRVYGQFTGVTISTTGVNGDTLSQIFATVPAGTLVGGTYSTSGHLKYRATPYSVTVSGLSTNQLGYANATYSNGTVTITRAALTISGAVVADKVYNGNTIATVTTTGNLAGLVSGDAVSRSLVSALFSSKNVGSNMTVAATYSIASTNGNADASNYVLTQPALTANITPATVSLSAAQLYSGSTALSNVTIGNLVGSETLTYSAATANSSHVGAGNFISAITLGNQSGANATAGGLASNYKLPTLNAANAPVTLTAVNLTLTATGNLSRAYDGTTNMTIAAGNYTVSGLLAGDSLTLGNASAAQYNNAHVASAANVTASNLTISAITSTTLGSLPGDYSLQTSSLKWGTGGQSGTYANITPALVTLTATGNFSRVYDGTTTATVDAGKYSIGGLVSGDSLTLTNLSTAIYNSAHVVGASNVTASGITLTGVSGNRSSALSDYALQTSSLVWGSGGQSGTNANITAAPLTVTGTLVASKAYDGTNTATLSNGTLVGVLAGDVLTLTQSGNFSGVNVGTNLGVTASDSIAVSSSNRSSVASDYSLTQPTGLTGNITKRVVTLSASKTYSGSSNISLNGNVTIGNLVGTQTLNYSGAVASSGQVASNGANYITGITLANGLNGGLASNYQLPTLNVANAPVTINKAPLGFAASATYQGSTAFSGLTTGISVYGLVAGESFTSATLTVANASVSANGANYINSLFLIGGTANMNNYVLGSSYNAVPGTSLNTFTINKAPLGISASGVYSGSTVVAPTSFTLTGLVGGETVGNITSLTVSNANVATASKRVTAIVVGNGTANMGNYVLGGSYNATANTTTTNAFTMTKAPLTVTADNTAMFVSQAVPGSYNVSYSGLVGGQTAGTAGLTVGSVSNSASTGSPAGSYVLTPSGWSASNYNISYANGSFTVVPANQLMVQVGSTSTSYGSTISYASPTVQYMAGNATLVTLTQTQQAGNTFTFADGSSGTVTFTLGAANASLSTGNQLVVGSYQVTGSNFSKTSNNFNGNITYTGSSTVSALGLTVNTGNVSKVYDGSDAMTGLTIGLSTVVAGDVVNVSGSGSFSQAGAGSNLSYNVSGLALGGKDAGNYFLSGGDSFSGSNGVISKAPLTVTANSTSTQYGLGTTLGSTAFTSSGLVNSETIDTVTLASAGAAVTANAGSYNITASSATGGTFDINNYNVSYVNGTLSVTAAPLTVTTNNQSRTYGAANPASGGVTLTSGQLYNSDTLSTASLSSTATSTSAVGNYTLTASSQGFSVGSASNYNITYVDGTLGVTPASLTVTANTTSTQYGLGTMLGTAAFSSSGLQNGETIGAVTLVSTGSAATSNVGSYNITASSATGGTFDINNYNVSYVNGTLSVTAAPLTVTANNQSRTYGAANPASGAVTVTGGQLYNSDTLSTASLSSAANATSAVGNYTLTASAQTFSAGSASNYNITYVDGTLGVNPANLTVTANSTSTQYGLGTTLGTAAFSSSGLQNGETIGAVTLASTGVAATSNAGSYNITAASATGGTFDINNYNVSYANGTLTVTQAPLTLTANNQSRSYGAANPTAGAVTVTGGQLYNSDTLSTASLSSAATSTSAVGNYTLTASNQGFSVGSASNYNITYVDGTLGVNPASLTVTANSTSTQYGLGTTLGSSAFSSTGLVNGETIGAVTLASTGSAATSNVGGYNITATSATGGSFTASNYNISYANGTLSVTTAPLTVTANNQSRSYGATNPTAGAVTVTGGQLYNSDTLGNASLSSTANATSAVGNYTLTASSQGFSAGSASNYNITYVDGTLGVTPASLTVTANNASKTYGQTLTFAGTEFTSNGLVNGETLSAVALASSGAAASAQVNGGVAYAIGVANASGANGFVASNYNISYANGSFTVNPAPLGVSASGVYSGSTVVVPTAFTLTGLVNGETVQDVASVTLNNANVVSANRVTAISVGNGTANMANYVLNASPNANANTSTTNTFSMSKAPLTVQADNAAMFIGETLPGSHSVSYRGFVNGESAGTASGLSAGAVVNTANANSGAGSYTLTPSGWSADNYSLSYTAGTFSVVGANQLLIQAGSNTGTYGSAATLAPVSVQYKSTGGPVVNLTLASSLGNNSYLYNDPYGGSVTFSLNAANASFSGSGKLKADSYQLAGTVSNVTGGNFNGTAVYTGSLTLAPLAVLASTSQVSKVYDGSTAMNGLVLDITPTAVNGDSVMATGSGMYATRNAGSNLSYSVTGLVLAGSDAGNYVLSGGATSFSGNNGQIVAKTVTLTPQAVSKVYDGSVVAAANLSQFSSQLGVAGDTVSALTLVYDDKNVGTVKTLTASNAVISDGNGGNNYNIVYANASVGTVTRLNSVSWVGGATGNWFDPANWAGGAVPDLSNVANVLIPSGVTVSFGSTVVAPAQSGVVNIDSLGGASGNLSQSAGTLNVGTGGITLAALTQTGGSTTVAGNATVDNLSQGNGTLSVSGDLTVNTNLSQTAGNTTVGGNTTVAGDAALAGDLSTGNLSANTTTISGGNTNVTGNSVTTGNLTITGGNTTIGGNSSADNLTMTGGNTTVAGNATVGNLSQGNGTLSVGGTLAVSNNLTQTAGNTSVSGNATVGSNATVAGNITTGNLSSSNTTVSGGNTNVTGNSTTTGNLTITGGNTSVGGSSTAGNLSISGGSTTVAGNTTVGGNTTVSGNLTTGNLSSINTTLSGGNTNVTGNSTTTGNLTITGGNAIVGGNSTAGNLLISGGTTTMGSSRTGNLTVTGGNTTVTGNNSITGNLTLTGGNTTVRGNTSVRGSTTVGGTATVTGNISADTGGATKPPEHHSVKVQGGTNLFPILPTPLQERDQGVEMPELSVEEQAERTLIVDRRGRAKK